METVLIVKKIDVKMNPNAALSSYWDWEDWECQCQEPLHQSERVHWDVGASLRLSVVCGFKALRFL